MKMRILFPVVVITLMAGPASAWAQSCFCNSSGGNTVTENVITRTVVIDDCRSEPSCTVHGRDHRPWHPRPWHPRWHAPVAPIHQTDQVTDNTTQRQTSRAGGAVVNIYTAPGAAPVVAPTAAPTAAPSVAPTVAPTGAPVIGTPSSSSSSSTSSSGGDAIAALNQRVDGLNDWFGRISWIAALLALLIAAAILVFALWALRGMRHDSRASAAEARHSAQTAAELEAKLRHKDSELERIAEDVAQLRRDKAATRETVIHERTEHDRAGSGVLVAEAAVATAAVAGAAHHRNDAPRDHDLDRIRDEMARLRLELERQRDTSATSHTVRHPAHVETATVVEDVAVVATVAQTAVRPTHAPAPHPAIDETDWSVTHYRVVIGEARARKHDRPQARQDIIHYADLLLTRHADNAEAVSYAHVSKAEALAEAGDHVAALRECETVIALHGADSPAAVRTQLAQAHFTKAAIHAQHKDVAGCTAALDEWAHVHGIFDTRMVVEDVRFSAILSVTAFQVYIAQKHS